MKFFKYIGLGSAIGLLLGGIQLGLDRWFNKFDWFLAWKDVCSYVMISLTAVLFLSVGGMMITILVNKLNNK